MFKKMKIRTKLLLGFIIVAIIAGVIGIIGITQLGKISKADTEMYNNVAVPLGYTTQIASDFQRVRVNARDAIYAETVQERNEHLGKISDFDKSLDEYLKKYEGTIIDEADKKNFKDLCDAKKAYMDFVPEMTTLLNANNQKGAIVLLKGDWKRAADKLQTAMDNLVEYNIKSGKETTDGNASLSHSAIILLIIFIIIGIIIAMAIGIWISSNIQNIIKSLVSQAKMLADAAIAGKLDTRGDPEKVNFEVKEIVIGVNNTLDAVIGPLNVAAEYVDRISKGDIPQKITDNYNGDFNEIKNNLNHCIDNLNGLINEMNHMSKEHDLGDIDVMIDSNKLQGSYKEMGEGINKMVGGHIAVKKKAMACIKEFGKGNFEAPLEKFPGKKVFINETIEQMRANLKALIVDAKMLAKAAVDGNPPYSPFPLTS